MISVRTVEGELGYFMMKYMMSFIFAIVCSMPCIADQLETEELKIGVLSKRGPDMVYKRWSSLADYLTNTLPQYQFKITPLTFEEIEPAVVGRQIDFLLTNSGMFVNLSFTYDLSAIATLKRKILGQAYMEFGSVVFTKVDRTEIIEYPHLVSQRVAAVNERSLGGWIGALRELDSLDISSESFLSLDFLGTHDAVVYAVKDNKTDVGIVRTDTLERMAAEGKIDLTNFKAIPLPIQIKTAKGYSDNYPLMLSSRLYPEWPMIRLPHVPDNLAERVSSALLLLPADSKAAVEAKIMGWTIPKNYREVDLAFSQLKQGAYKKLTNYSIVDVIERYWKYFFIVLFFITTMIVTTLYILRLNKDLKRSQAKLKTLATHDNLTRLPNRILFSELANKYIAIAKRENRNAIVMFMDLDRFKNVNDNYGHDVGDHLLKEIAGRIANILRSDDVIARIGGDEFLVMLWNVESITNAEEIMRRLIQVASLPIQTNKSEPVEVGCSIGASYFPQHDDQLDGLIKKADIALYQAKNKGRGTYVIYN